MNNTNTYIVQKGDTLYGISRQHNTSAQKIRELNNLKSDFLVVGQTLILQDNNGSNPSECVIYTVERGDNLYNIAKKYDTTADEIKRYNNLNTNLLSIGQKLKIPCHMEDTDDSNISKYVSYTVEKGDSLYSIAQKFGTTVDKIKIDNELKSNTLTIGDTLKIEDNAGISSVLECYGIDFELPEDYSDYTVQKGDNLYSIAKRYNTTVSEIMKLNNLTNTALKLGQKLKIPTTVTKYKVQKGDSLYSIAQKFNTTVSDIKTKNNLKSNLLNIGDELVI